MKNEKKFIPAKSKKPYLDKIITHITSEFLNTHGYPKDKYKVRVYTAGTDNYPTKRDRLWINITDIASGELLKLQGRKLSSVSEGVGFATFMNKIIKNK